ncbi:MAG: ABC transporter permease [Lachnospiraceae bacterium]
MNNLLMIREQLKKIYGMYGTYIKPAIHFIVMLVSIIIINANAGAMALLKNPAVVVIISLIGAFLPVKFMTILLSLIIVAHMSAIAVEIGAMIFLIMLIMYLLFFRFTPKDSVILILIPLLFFIKIPYVVPLTVGMASTPFSIISVSFGVIIFYILNYISTNLDAIMAAASTDGMGQMTKIAGQVFTSKELYLIIIAFALVVAVVYFVKRLSIDYSWIIAVVSGGVLCIIIMLIGELIFDMGEVVSVVSIIIGGIISIVLALGIRFFIHSVDYSRTEYTQFEDDDFYYYVKAVPKIKVSSPEVNVKRINARKVRKK